MALHLKSLVFLGGTRVQVEFNDGRQGTADLAPLLCGPIFEGLQQTEAFQSGHLDRELGTLVWPNGADLAPEAIYFAAFQSEPALQPLFARWGYASTGQASGHQR